MRQFSIVIPLYNKEKTIERTLASVFRQTYAEFEVIVVNDGSTDNSLGVIHEFKKDIRLQVIEQHNQGVSAARNKGVALAKYDHIAFLDGDDEWLPSYLEKMKEAIDLHPDCGMYCCAGIYKENNDEILAYRIAGKYKDTITKINYFENPHVFTHTSATIVNKQEFLKCGGFPLGMRKNEDFTLFYSIALISEVVYCGFPLSCYYGNVDGQVTSLKSESNELELDVIKRFNLVHQTWNNSTKENNIYKTFIKYEIRHILLGSLKSKNYSHINLFISHLDSGVKSLFSKIEFYFIKNKMCNKVSIIYLLLTKIAWRTKGYPITGKG